MSPLARSPLTRSLLALALAALLHAACAQDQCTPKAKGRDGRKIEFPLIKLNASLTRDICFDMRDEYHNKDVFCQEWFNDYEHNYELVGLSALACDWEVVPGLEISDDLTKVCVHRKRRLEPDATLKILEFCLPTKWTPGATLQL